MGNEAYLSARIGSDSTRTRSVSRNGRDRARLAAFGAGDFTNLLRTERPGECPRNGMPRFFRRLAEGIFDEEDLIFRTKEVYDFLDAAAVEHGFDRSNVVAIGYSNGANIAGSLLFHYPNALRAAILHHPMVPRRGLQLPDLSDTPVFIGAGKNDPICSLRSQRS